MHIFKSIKSRLIYSSLITSTLLIAVFILFSYQLSEEAFRKMVDDNSFYNVKNYSRFIGEWFNERMNEMDTYSRHPIIKNYDSDKIESYLRMEAENKSDIYDSFFVVNSNGDSIISSEENIINIRDREYFEEAMKGKSIVSNPIFSKATGEPISVVASPIMDDNGEVIGIIGGTITLDSMFKFIDNFKVDDEYSYSYIIDKEGLIITHPDEEYILNFNIIDNINLIDKDTKKIMGKEILDLDKGVLEYTHEGVKTWAYFSEIPNTDGWRIVTKIPHDYITSPIKRISTSLFLVGAIIVFISIFFNIFNAKKISDPIIKLKDTITKNTSGGMKKVEIDSNDEIGVLAKSFNHMMEVISDLTYYDPLTKLPARKVFDEQLARAIKHCNRNKENLGVVIIGIDKFKNVNDAFGLNVGDNILRQVSIRIKGTVRQEDVVTRITGDEFAILFPEIQGERDVVQYTEEIIKYIKLPFKCDDNIINISVSGGIAFYPKDGKTKEALVKNANIALHKAKHSGGGSYQLYNSTMKQELLEQLEFEKMISGALDRGEFSLNYQPIVEIDTLEITGIEALLRWNHPVSGMISPVKFIPIAEENGLIIPLGKWVLETACKQIKEWHNKGLKKILVAVNISLKQFQDKGFVEMVQRILKETGLEPQYLCLEITESVAMENEDYAIKVLNKLKTMGIKVAIDDFGTGYSSLEYLTKFPLDTLKIDKSFILNIKDNENDASIASTIIAMGHNLKLGVTAEGVETLEQLEYLKSQKCNNIQGYLFSKPVDGKALEQLLDATNFKNRIQYIFN